jgi:hypothetical protein
MRCCVAAELFTMPAPPIDMFTNPRAVIVKGLAFGSNRMRSIEYELPVTRMVGAAELLNRAVSAGSLGTVAGVQFDAVPQLLLVGSAAHVALARLRRRTAAKQDDAPDRANALRVAHRREASSPKKPAHLRTSVVRKTAMSTLRE